MDNSCLRGGFSGQGRGRGGAGAVQGQNGLPLINKPNNKCSVCEKSGSVLCTHCLEILVTIQGDVVQNVPTVQRRVFIVHIV